MVSVRWSAGSSLTRTAWMAWYRFIPPTSTRATLVPGRMWSESARSKAYATTVVPSPPTTPVMPRTRRVRRRNRGMKSSRGSRGRSRRQPFLGARCFIETDPSLNVPGSAPRGPVASSKLAKRSGDPVGSGEPQRANPNSDAWGRPSVPPKSCGLFPAPSPTGHPEQPPWPGHAPELVDTPVLEPDPRSGHQVLHGLRDEHLPRLRHRRDAGRDVHRDPAELLAHQLALARVDPGPDV